MPAGPPGYIQQVLEEAERLAGVSSSGFAERVQARLVKGAAEYGADGYLQRPLSELLEEIAEEARDLAGWSALALDALSAREDVGEELRGGLLEVAVLGVRGELLAVKSAAAWRVDVDVGIAASGTLTTWPDRDRV